jgi:protein-disulfide isomerase
MTLSRKDVLQLCAIVAAAALLPLILRAVVPVGQDVSDNPLVRAVREDRSSPTEEAPSADLTLIVFTDYQCAACRGAHLAMRKAVSKDGKVRTVYKDWPIFGSTSTRAAEVSIASTYQRIYPLVHDQLMSGRVDSDDALQAAVEHAGGDWLRLKNDLRMNRAEITAQIGRNRMQAFGLGLAGTPGYLVGPILVRGALTEAEFTRVFREARNASKEQ